MNLTETDILHFGMSGTAEGSKHMGIFPSVRRFLIDWPGAFVRKTHL